jgi:hypothetical protein
MEINPLQFKNSRKRAARLIGNLKKSDPQKYWSVSKPGTGYKVHPVGQDGFVGLKDNKDSVDIGGLVAKPGVKGVTGRAMNIADRQFPEHPQTLDAFDGNLPKIYAGKGFTETGRMPFDANYAPPEYDAKVHGKPDVVMMGRPAAQGSLFPDKYPTTPQKIPDNPKDFGPSEVKSPKQFQNKLF